MISLNETAEAEAVMRSYQQGVARWMDEVFGADTASDVTERSMRFLEEALELVQALGLSHKQCALVSDYVFNRPVGDPPQEVGGTMVTLAGLCEKTGIDMGHEAIKEYLRIDTPEMKVRIHAKQAYKRSFGMTSDTLENV